MKCPHCKKPVHVHSMTLGKGRTKYTMSPSLKKKADTASHKLAMLIQYLSDKGFNYRDISYALGVSEGRAREYVTREDVTHIEQKQTKDHNGLPTGRSD